MSFVDNAIGANMILAQNMGHTVDAERSWDLEKFFNNATSYTQTIGGAFLALIGIAGIVWGGFLLIRKLMGGQQAQQDSWFKIVALIIVGGTMLFGGMAILLNFADGAKKTIEEFGGNTALVNSVYDGALGLSMHASQLVGAGAGILF